jgi:cell division septum initiation protein DivIVA
MDRPTPDTQVAQAINRVLAAEREAAGAIEAAQLEAESLIEAARAERRRLLERARQRAARLHAAAQSRLERALARLDRGATAPGTDIGALHELTQQAVGRLAKRLTTAGHEPG